MILALTQHDQHTLVTLAVVIAVVVVGFMVLAGLIGLIGVLIGGKKINREFKEFDARADDMWFRSHRARRP